MPRKDTVSPLTGNNAPSSAKVSKKNSPDMLPVGKESKDITIRDIADLAEVSVATVSYVLNGKKKVSRPVQEKILALTEQLGYQANPYAQNLRKKDIQEEIQVFLPGLQGQFFSEIISGVENFIAANTDYLLNFSCNLIRNYPLLHSISRGFIIFYTAIEDAEIERCLNTPNKKTVSLIDRRLEPKFDELYTSVSFDNYNGSVMAARYLYEIYGPDICLIAGPKDSPDSLTRIKGYMDFMSSVHAPTQIHTANFITATAYDQACRLIRSGKLARAYFCTNDEMAYGFLQAFQQNDIRIPEEVAVMGFDDLFFSQHTLPALTTIRQPIAEMGVEATRLLLQQIKGEPIAERHVVFQPELVRRKSA